MNINEIKISQRDFQSLQWNPFAPEFASKSLTTKYDVLKRAWSRHKMPLEIEKYICSVYDINTPLLKAYTDEIERKKVAGLLSGFKINESTGFFEKQYDDVLNCRDSKVNRNIIEYVKLFANSEYVHYVSLTQTYQQILDELHSIKKGETNKTDAEIAGVRATAAIKLNTVHELIRDTEIRLLRDNTALLKQDLYRIVSEQLQTLMISPERRLLKQQ